MGLMRDHDLNLSQTLNRLSHPGAPQLSYFNVHLIIIFRIDFILSVLTIAERKEGRMDGWKEGGKDRRNEGSKKEGRNSNSKGSISEQSETEGEFRQSQEPDHANL